MGLTCERESGTLEEVFKELLFKLNIPQRDIHLLNGPVDILLQFNKLKDTQEFVNQCFNPLRMVGAKKNLIKKIMSFIVISPGPIPAEKPFAFVFMNTHPRNLESVRTGLLALPQVLSADSVFGPYGLICSVKARNDADCESVVSSIESLPGVQNLTTSLVIQ